MRAKILKRKHRGNHHDIELGSDIFGNDIKNITYKRKKHKLDYLKIKNFCASKETINKAKKQSTDERKRANHTF